MATILSDQKLSEYDKVALEDNDTAIRDEFNELHKQILQIKKEGYLALVNLLEVVEKYLTAQTDKTINNELKGLIANGIVGDLVLQPYTGEMDKLCK